MCDDLDATVGELRAKGAQFRGPIEEQIYGRIIMMIVPGADDIQLYQPTHTGVQWEGGYFEGEFGDGSGR